MNVDILSHITLMAASTTHTTDPERGLFVCQGLTAPRTMY